MTNQTSTSYGIERIEVSDGRFLTDADVSLMIQQMAPFAAEKGIPLATVDDVRKNRDLMGMIVHSWHT